MQRKRTISKILLTIAMLFTVVFQFAHSFLHISDFHDSSDESGAVMHVHHKTSDLNGFDVFSSEKDIEKCFACDFFLSSFIYSEISNFVSPALLLAFKAQDALCHRITSLSHIFFSLRAPPLFN